MRRGGKLLRTAPQKGKEKRKRDGRGKPEKGKFCWRKKRGEGEEKEEDTHPLPQHPFLLRQARAKQGPCFPPKKEGAKRKTERKTENDSGASTARRYGRRRRKGEIFGHLSELPL